MTAGGDAASSRRDRRRRRLPFDRRRPRRRQADRSRCRSSSPTSTTRPATGLRRRARAAADDRDGRRVVHQRAVRAPTRRSWRRRSKGDARSSTRRPRSSSRSARASKYVLAGDVSRERRRLHACSCAPSIRRTARCVKAASADAKTKADVLPAVGSLAGRLRAALGDKTRRTSKRGRTRRLPPVRSTRSASTPPAQELALARQDDEAVAHYRRAIELDPKFGRAYSGLAVSAQRLGNSRGSRHAPAKHGALADGSDDRAREVPDARAAIPRRRRRTTKRRVENYSALVTAYPADDAGPRQSGAGAFLSARFRQGARGSAARRRAEPEEHDLQRDNLALYAMYAGDFATARGRGRKVIAEKARRASTYLPLAMEAVAKGDMPPRRRAYDEMAKTGARGASLAEPRARGPRAVRRPARRGEAELKAGLAADLRRRTPRRRR